MSDNRYNGWRNRETWLVNVWYNPETKSDIDWIEEELNRQYDEMPDGALKDMLDVNCIDWDELRDSLEDDSEEETEE